jgi:DNA-binding MarR family transcriptional regulator
MAIPRILRRPAAEAAVMPRTTYLVGRLERVLRRQLAELLIPVKLSVAQYTTLSVLQARGYRSNAELAKRAFISPQAMHQVMQGLERRKLVSRLASQSHGRIVQLLLTPKGVELMRDCDAAVNQLELKMLKCLSIPESKLLRAALAACTHALEGRSAIGTRSAVKEAAVPLLRRKPSLK